jgi:hypothetical protein
MKKLSDFELILVKVPKKVVINAVMCRKKYDLM